jgi:hypothetical protein
MKDNEENLHQFFISFAEKYCKEFKKDIPMNITDHKCNKQITNCILQLRV